MDNYKNINKINNQLIGPMIDRNGEVKGVLQLINKEGDGIISEQDVIEMNALLPALGEIIRTADESMEITRISYGTSLFAILLLCSFKAMFRKYN